MGVFLTSLISEPRIWPTECSEGPQDLPAWTPHSTAEGMTLTHIVLNVADVEGGSRDSQTQSIFLGDKDGLGEAMLLQVAQCELAAWHAGHYILRTVGKACVRGQQRASGQRGRPGRIQPHTSLATEEAQWWH